MSRRRPLTDRIADHYGREVRRARAAALRCSRAGDHDAAARWAEYADRVAACLRRSIVTQAAA